MTPKELNDEYFMWICQLVADGGFWKHGSFQKLLRYLHRTPFNYTIPLDGNRAADGIDLRYRFGSECAYPDSMIATYLDVTQCSILEMMAALASRCESQFMCDPDIGNRTKDWFWMMIGNLGLSTMTDTFFDKTYVNHVISRLLNHQYARNGLGGLFTVEQCERDFRTMEIWDQMCWYIDSLI